MLTDTHKKNLGKVQAHRHSSKPWQLDAEMLSVVSGEGAWGCLSPQWGSATQLLTANQMLNTIFIFHF